MTKKKELKQIMRRIDKIYLVKKDCKWIEETEKMKSIIN